MVEARSRPICTGSTVLFLDEIHRFNRAQQDALLPFVEDGTLILIGATTENPFFSVNGPLLSRSRVVPLVKLTPSHLEQIIEDALQDEERGLGAYAVEMTDPAKKWLARAANGVPGLLSMPWNLQPWFARRDPMGAGRRCGAS